jgi:hypothetical protein
MTSVVDVWRAIDPEATLLSGSLARLQQVVRGVMRTRVAPPHLPRPAESALLVADAGLLRPVDALLASLRRAELEPVAVLLAGIQRRDPAEGSDAPLPVLASALPVAAMADAAAAYLADEAEWLDRAGRDLRLACAEATLADPEIGTPAGLMAARLRRGVAVSADGELRSLHARPSGRALAARFAAIHARLLAGGQRQGGQRSTRDGLWLVERVVRPGASVWIFDDAPLAAVDEVAAEALSLTLRALLRRAPAPAAEPAPRRPPRSDLAPPAVVPGTYPFAETLLAVARHNGRVLPAARELGVHRNTVLYRLRRARAETGLDPRRPADALAILGLARD